MIRINLLKQTTKKKVARKGLSQKNVILLFSVVGGAVLLVGIVFVIKSFLLVGPKKEVMMAQDDYMPSTFTNANAIEEPVRDMDHSKDKLNQRGLLDIAYSEMSLIEKINYEIHFAKNVCDLLSNTVLPGVDFKTLEMQQFTTFKGSGLSSSKAGIVTLLKSLRSKKIELLPKPQTLIKKNNEGYSFTLACKTNFGLNLEAPFILGHNDLPAYEELSHIVEKVKNTAEDEQLNLSSKLTKKDSSLKGDFRQFQYRLKGVATYKDFVAFVNSLYTRNIPCSFKSAKVTAKSEHAVTIEADLIITTAY